MFSLNLQHLSFLNLQKPKPNRNLVITACLPSYLPARDIVIDFGKYKGSMLGTLPSTYLKWMSKNLQDFEAWAILADQVLQDPVYNDRVEWEYADRLMSGDGVRARNYEPDPEDLIELSQRFGWDFEDKFGWGRVNFQLLGTSKSGRLPRIKDGTKEVSRPADDSVPRKRTVAKVSLEETRIKRLERSRMRRNVNENKSAAGAGAGSRASAGAGSLFGASAGSRAGTGAGSRAGASAGSRVGAGAGSRAGAGAGSRAGAGAGSRAGAGSLGDGAGSRAGAGAGSGAEAGGSRVGGETGVYNPFPGRETLLQKALNRRKLG